MSELKAFNMPRYVGEFTTHKVYLKSEADQVIARHKYKRCLAMASRCREAICYWDKVKYTHFKGEAYCFRKLKHYGRWGLIWLAIAEKFKPNKEAK